MVNTPERAPGSAPQLEKSGATVQPVKTETMSAILMDVNDAIKESNAAAPTEQWSGNGQAATSSGIQPASQGMSWRDQAIANLPVPVVMQQKLHKHIEEEIKELRKQASKITDLRKPGAANHFNQLHAKIHRLNSLLAGLFEASIDVIKRIFIRVFIDKQPIL